MRRTALALCYQPLCKNNNDLFVVFGKQQVLAILWHDCVQTTWVALFCREALSKFSEKKNFAFFCLEQYYANTGVLDLKWFTYFVAGHANSVRESTRKLIMALDFRAFATDVPASFAGTNGHGFSKTLRLIGPSFPAVRCILLGGNSGYDPSDLGHLLRPEFFPEDGSTSMPMMLDIGCCGMALPNNFFHPSYWRQLVYLDMSGVPGSLKGIVKTGTFHKGALPNLRILKLRGRELDEASLAPIAAYSRQHIWSLDLSYNKLTDGCVRRLFYLCFGIDDLTAQKGRYEVEGELVMIQGVSGVELEAEVSPMWRGWFSYIVESSLSATFAHPDRYLADSPVYDEGSQNAQRLAGNEPLRSDRVDDVKITLAGGPGQPAPDWHDVRNADICKPPPSLTHISLSGNPDFSIEGVESMFRFSRGHIEHFDCASPAIATHGQVPFTLAGIVGRSHLFRPVFASNLQSLRIHHSLVTHIPTFYDPTKSVLAALEYAETVLRKRAEMAYPLEFVPDLSPRLQSLTLTCLPRVSTGPLINKLLQFLSSASDQEHALRAQQSAIPISRRGPTMLRGLRHIRLEFEPYPPQDHVREDTFESLDAEALLNSSSEGFSFFKEEMPATVTDARKKKAQVGEEESAKESGKSISTSGGSSRCLCAQPKQTDTGGVGITPSKAAFSIRPSEIISGTEVAGDIMAGRSDRLAHYPLPEALHNHSEYVREVLSLEEAGTGNKKTTIKVSVWVGTGQPGPSKAVNAYMANLSRESLRTHIRPATPDQVKAGVPVGACIYNAAWDAILWLVDDTAEEESRMKRDGEASQLPTGATSTQLHINDESRLPSSRRQGQYSESMHDVVEAIRQFRAETRATYRPRTRTASPTSPTGHPGGEPLQQKQQERRVPCHWTGKLEVMLAS